MKCDRSSIAKARREHPGLIYNVAVATAEVRWFDTMDALRQLIHEAPRSFPEGWRYNEADVTVSWDFGSFVAVIWNLMAGTVYFYSLPGDPERASISRTSMVPVADIAKAIREHVESLGCYHLADSDEPGPHLSSSTCPRCGRYFVDDEAPK